jgi:tetratricopeptide (TPR) repeat protein
MRGLPVGTGGRDWESPPAEDGIRAPNPNRNLEEQVMTRIIDSQVERLKRATQHPTDVWQGGIFRIPGWIKDKEGDPYRALLPVWISMETGAAFAGDIMHPSELDLGRAIDALAEGAMHSSRGGYRPARLEVNDPALEEYLRGKLSDLGIEVSQLERLEHIEAFLQAMGEDTTGPMSMCAALNAPGVTVERMRAFADAAADFYRAAMWNHLSSVDLIHVESTAPDPHLSHLVVMGVPNELYGVVFFTSTEEFETITEAEDPPAPVAGHRVWSLGYGPIMAIPFPDVDLWEDHGLSVAGPEAYPSVFCTEQEESYTRPDAQRLSFIEGLLRALAATTEDELDSGRWTKDLSTFDGKTAVTLALPRILDARPIHKTALRSGFPDRRSMEKLHLALDQMLEGREFDSVEEMNTLLENELQGRPSPEFKIRNKKEKALDLFYQAIEAEGRLKIKLARQALATDPDCADAYVLLAECMPDPQRRYELYQKGMEAAERTIGRKAFEEDVGHFWGITKTRPYMRARLGIAECLISSGRVDEAIGHYRELLHLNPEDNQGIRFLLVPLLLERGEDAEAGKLLDSYDVDNSTPLAYARALLAFRKEGDSRQARKQLELAVKKNPHMVKLLLGTGKVTEDPPEYYRLGSKEEAIAYGPDAFPAWQKTAGAVAWLKGWRKDRKKTAAGKRKGARKAARPGVRGRRR